MKIVLTGGGTAGSVTPLLAVVEEINKTSKEHSYTFIGTHAGQTERDLIRSYDIPYKGILSGKLRRYWSIFNILAPIFILIGYVQSLIYFIELRPQILFTAGGYVGVPCVWAAWSLGIKVVIHQPDIQPGLASIMTQMFATKISVGYQETERFFPKNKVVWLGNPVRPSLLKSSKDEARKFFSFTEDIPVVLVIGGGTGSKDLNDLVFKTAKEIQKNAYVILVSGKGKSVNIPLEKRFRIYEFLTDDEIRHAIHVSDVVISRAGVGAISEFSLLKKACIFIPLPQSPQEKNVEMFSDRNAAIVQHQKSLNSQKLVHVVTGLLNDVDKRKKLGSNLHSLFKDNAAQKMAQLILSIGNS